MLLTKQKDKTEFSWFMSFSTEMNKLWGRWMDKLKPFWWVILIILLLVLSYFTLTLHSFPEGSIMNDFAISYCFIVKWIMGGIAILIALAVFVLIAFSWGRASYLARRYRIDSKTSREIEEDQEDSEEENKKPYVRQENYGKALEVKIDYDRFHSVFKESFIRRNINNDSCSYDTLVNAIENHGWKKSDLARLALLIYESDVLKGECSEMSFKDWLVRFFDMMGRNDYPKAQSKDEYRELWRSAIDFSKTFNDLLFSHYNKTDKTILIIKEPAPQKS